MDSSQVVNTMNDEDVLSFCKNGYLMYQSVVPDEINQWVTQFLETHEPTDLLQEDRFIEHVLLNPQAADAVRALLGANFALPTGMANHRVECPADAQSWHRDGGSRMGYEVNHLQVFYYPQDTPLELGPTEVLPGSHFIFALQHYMAHYDRVRGAVQTSAPAGSIFITAYNVWHRRGRSTATGLRNMLKYCYWRMSPPSRDWIADPNFDFGHDHSPHYAMDGPTFRVQFREWYDAARMFYWLCDKTSDFDAINDGREWPPGHPILWKPEGFRRFGGA
ncbi:MAG: hypothetical protein HOH43_14215 [Candidatus Latescibacteria bacterium]|nr:hypothetical protein [Candidatus Latescibacterota bacterium]